LRHKEKQNKARKVSLTMAMYSDHGYQFQYHLSNEESVKEFYRQHGYNCEIVDEEVHNKLAWILIIDVRTFSSFMLRGAPDSITGTKGGGNQFLVKFEGETGHVVKSEYTGIFEHAVEQLNRSLERSRYRDFLTIVSEGIASIEAYINYRANQIGGQQYGDSKQHLVSFDDTLRLLEAPDGRFAALFFKPQT
jgi:hypothetical protein